MGADGADADKIFFGNFFIAQPFDQGIKNFIFPCRQVIILHCGAGCDWKDWITFLAMLALMGAPP